MCGICGAVQVGSPPRTILPPDVLDRMTDAMAHRGPSDRGVVNRDGIALGARRLSIIDLDGGHQPFTNETGHIVAAQNGELYNHDQLRSQLRAHGHVIRSRCDTEVLPHLYEQYGDDFAQQLDGKFAIALWDGVRRRAILVRDRLGIKPLYYAQRGDRLVFSSELKSLLASGVISDDLDLEAIGAYLQLGFFPTPHTPLKDVRKLRPGHILVIDSTGVRERQYWAFPRPHPDARLSEHEASELLMSTLEDAVRKRLMSDVPLGAMLSGGLDSSLVVALMARNMGAPVQTFAVGFSGAGVTNELEDARQVAKLFGADHHELELSFDEQDITVEDLAWWLDEPLVDLSALGFLALSKLAASHVTVALSGQGADEMLAGYSRYVRAAFVGHARRLPDPLLTMLVSPLRALGGRYRRFAHAIQASDPAVRHLSLRQPWVSPDLFPRLTRGDVRASGSGAALMAVRDHTRDLDVGPLQASLYLDSKLTLLDDMIHYFDRASMAHSLEVRMPFLDHRFVELCATIPDHLKVRRMTTKYLLKAAASELLPDHVVNKHKVGFFNQSMDGWTQKQLRGSAGAYLLGESPACADFLDARVVRDLAQAAAHGNTTNLGALYAVLMLEVWLSTTLPSALAPPLEEREQIFISQ